MKPYVPYVSTVEQVYVKYLIRKLNFAIIISMLLSTLYV